ncbi:hypothetical protein [Marinobacter zhanjiangensis]|uniref:DUF305 domain-containing protein n=1 Tax=Marinobacter zhanjiangensis TaxID=578215 RepID=A0ABQ3ALZ1_9GAMM|nr:hypothetical protein [Marinobacter zhanjiangensis]GGY60438.1 hypothetical protein GCM10007071_03850 [Marinobacter zhanjiangensis]
MKSTKLKLAGAAVVLAAAIGSMAVYAHQSEHGGMGMMSGHMGNMEGMEGMMEMMSSMSEEDHSAMHTACLKMMDSANQSESGTTHSDHHDGELNQ